MVTQEDSDITRRMNVDLFVRVTYSSLKLRETIKDVSVTREMKTRYILKL